MFNWFTYDLSVDDKLDVYTKFRDFTTLSDFITKVELIYSCKLLQKNGLKSLYNLLNGLDTSFLQKDKIQKLITLSIEDIQKEIKVATLAFEKVKKVEMKEITTEGEQKEEQKTGEGEVPQKIQIVEPSPQMMKLSERLEELTEKLRQHTTFKDYLTMRYK